MRDELIAHREDFLESDLRLIETLVRNANFYRKTVSSVYLGAMRETIATACLNIRRFLKDSSVPVSNVFKIDAMRRVGEVEMELQRLWAEQPTSIQYPAAA
jgi:hypothetical protein